MYQSYFLNFYKAIKICDRKKLKRKLLTVKIDAYRMLDREIAIMKKLDHKNIVKLFEVEKFVYSLQSRL